MIARLAVVWRVLFGRRVYEPEAAPHDGWTDWIHPEPGYRLECCDCGLIHRMQFAISDGTEDGAELNEGEASDRVIVFRASRA